jgi:hypothetical protein
LCNGGQDLIVLLVVLLGFTNVLRAVGEAEGQWMRLGGEDVVAVPVNGIIGVEEQIEVLERLREEKRFHLRLQRAVDHVVDCRKAARHAKPLDGA